MKYDFELDNFQKEAIKLIDSGHSVVVAAPTGAGKTLVAEHVVELARNNGRGAIYTAPVKAISNQKYRDFCAAYGPENVGIVTGDVAINSNAPIVVMTTEIFRNSLFDEKDRFSDVDWVIFDEIHYIDDYERGTVWEESLMFFPKHMRMLCLSATIPNLQEFVAWIQSIHSFPVSSVIEPERPVPLKHCFQCGNEILSSLGQLKKSLFRHYRQRLNVPAGQSLLKLINYIQAQQLFPCIYFVFARRRCEELALELSRFDFLSAEEKQKICTLYKELLDQYNISGEASAQKMLYFVERGIAYHHAGMLPSLKEVIERLFSSRLLKLIFTTETFALGVNMPARTVVFDELRKFYGISFDNMHTRDYYQMAGRAGRRGMDETGYVFSRINPRRMRFHDIKRVIKGPPEEVRSQFNSSYATLMHLYQSFGEDLYRVYPTSLHYFQSDRSDRRSAREVIAAKLQLLEDLYYIEGSDLTAKGKFASQMYGYELPLGEMYEERFLESLDEVSLAIVLGALIYEPRKNDFLPPLDDKAAALRKHCRHFTRKISKHERSLDIYPGVKRNHFHLSGVIHAWANGEKFADLQKYRVMDEGEIIRYMRMIIQIMRLLLASPFMDNPFKDKARRAIEMINRDAVDAERQLNAN